MSQQSPSEAPDSNNVQNYIPFPLNALPKHFRCYVQEVTDAIGCDSAYVALPMLASAGALAGNSRRLQVKSTWHALPTLWTIVIGESGTGKSPAMTEAIRPIRQLQQNNGSLPNRQPRKSVNYYSHPRIKGTPAKPVTILKTHGQEASHEL